MSFVRRRIDVTIQLGTGQFGESIGDTITLTAHRCMAEISSVTGDTQGQLRMTIYGLPQAVMNRLTVVGPVMSQIRGKNKIQVAAGDDGSVLSTIYAGTIDQAWCNYQNAPEAPLNITALSALAAAVKPIKASSYKGAVNAADIAADLAKQMGFTFVNDGVNVILNNPYLPGAALDQLKAICRAGGIEWDIDKGVLTIWKKNTTRTGDVPLLSPDTGLVGYPTFSSNGVSVTSLFNPNFRLGSQFEVKSSIPAACGKWNTYSIVHQLSSEMPSGEWFTHVQGYRPPQ